MRVYIINSVLAIAISVGMLHLGYAFTIEYWIALGLFIATAANNIFQ